MTSCPPQALFHLTLPSPTASSTSMRAPTLRPARARVRLCTPMRAAAAPPAGSAWRWVCRCRAAASNRSTAGARAAACRPRSDEARKSETPRR
eukprot:5055798-Pleurochrysis_carterae.AAC.4